MVAVALAVVAMLVGVVNGHYEHEHRDDSFFSRPEMTLVLAGGNRRGCSMVVLHQGGRGRPDPRCKSTFFYPISLGE